MATKKKTKKVAKKVTKKQTRSGKKARNSKRVALKKKVATSVRAAVKPKAKKALTKPPVSRKATSKTVPGKKVTKHKIRGKADQVGELSFENTGLGANTGGQSGDTQGLSGIAETDSESVKELLEEGQSFEAEVLEGVESVPDADQGEVRTHELPEDDVPREYLDKD